MDLQLFACAWCRKLIAYATHSVARLTLMIVLIIALTNVWARANDKIGDPEVVTAVLKCLEDFCPADLGVERIVLYFSKQSLAKQLRRDGVNGYPLIAVDRDKFKDEVENGSVMDVCMVVDANAVDDGRTQVRLVSGGNIVVQKGLGAVDVEARAGHYLCRFEKTTPVVMISAVDPYPVILKLKTSYPVDVVRVAVKKNESFTGDGKLIGIVTAASRRAQAENRAVKRWGIEFTSDAELSEAERW